MNKCCCIWFVCKIFLTPVVLETLKNWTCAFFKNKDLGIHWYLSAQGTLFHSVPWGNFDTNHNKKNVPLYFYDNTDDTFHHTKLNFGWFDTNHVLWGGFWPLKCVLFWNISSQGANGVKENRPLLVLPHLIQCLGRCLSTTHGMTRAAGCRFFLQPSGRLHLKGRGQGTGSGDVKSQLRK